VIDLGSVQDADGDTDAGWARMVEDADPRPADDDARPDGADGDWTAVVAPELVEDDSDSGAPGTEPQVGREDYETLMEGEDEP
jgi:hypothetical protein